MRDGKPGRKVYFQGVEADTQSKVLTEADKNCIKVGFLLFATGKVGTITDAYIKNAQAFLYIKNAARILYRATTVLSQMNYQRLGSSHIGGTKRMTILLFLEEEAVSEIAKGSSPVNWYCSRWPSCSPCHLFEIDATVADIYLVIIETGIIGRPVIYVIIDTFSGDDHWCLCRP